MTLLPISTMPSIVITPATITPIPATLATHIPRDQIFSPKIIPAKSPIHMMFIQPSATISRKYGQQHPKQYRPWYVPMVTAPVVPFLHLLMKKLIGDSQYPRHFALRWL